ncbi:MAG: PHB depolymerase family esterase [Trueperaceae bacterium]
MATEGAPTGPQAHRRGPSLALFALFAALVLAAACAPRTAPMASTEVAVAPRRSVGCDAAVATTEPDRLFVAGQERTFLARMPAGPATVPRDLVIAFHGRTNDAAQVRRYFGLDAALPEAIVVYPRALQATSNTFAWADRGDPPDRQRDFALVDDLIARFGAAHCLDLDRVFVVGHSLGAYFANDVACRLGDRIRAVASVAGGVQGDGCAGGVAALLVHHPDDRLVRMSEGLAARDAFLSANGLGAAPSTPVAGGALARLRCARHGDAGTADPVVWCARDDATTPRGLDPHTWPTGTAAAIAAFFAGLP